MSYNGTIKIVPFPSLFFLASWEPPLSKQPLPLHASLAKVRLGAFLTQSRTGVSDPHESTHMGHCGAGGAVSGGFGGGVEDLSSLKIPAILPKKPFFFLESGLFGSCVFWAWFV
jgi:hypothetical protein